MVTLPTSFDSVSNDISSIQSSLSQYVVSPLNAFGLGGFVFDVEGTTTANLNSEITDHYAEDNNYFQDHIAVKPKKFILRNYVGELVNRLDSNTNTLLQNVTQKLTTISAFLPTLAAGVQQAKGIFAGGNFSNLSSSINTLTSQSTLSDASSLYGAVKNLIGGNTRQEKAYLYFKSLLEQKILFSVQTPFEFVSNMAIESIVATQRDESAFISDFSITLKQIRFASTKTVLYNSSTQQSPSNPNSPSTASNISPGLAGITGAVNNNTLQSSSPIQNGSVNGISVPVTSYQNLINQLK